MEFTIPEEELSAHLITAPKYFLAVQWSVGVEQAIALQLMPLLALMAARRRATSPRLCIAREQAGQGGDDHEVLFVLNVGIGFLLQQRRERPLIVRADKSLNTWRAW